METKLTLCLPEDFLVACSLVNAEPGEVLRLLAKCVSVRAALSEEKGEGGGAMAAEVFRSFVLRLTDFRPMPAIDPRRKALHLRHARHVLNLVNSGVPFSDRRYIHAVEEWHREIKDKKAEP